MISSAVLEYCIALEIRYYTQPGNVLPFVYICHIGFTCTGSVGVSVYVSPK